MCVCVVQMPHCRTCNDGRIFQAAGKLVAHFKSTHPLLYRKNIHCYICSNFFNSSGELAAHECDAVPVGQQAPEPALEDDPEPALSVEEEPALKKTTLQEDELEAKKEDEVKVNEEEPERKEEEVSSAVEANGGVLEDGDEGEEGEGSPQGKKLRIAA